MIVRPSRFSFRVLHGRSFCRWLDSISALFSITFPGRSGFFCHRDFVTRPPPPPSSPLSLKRGKEARWRTTAHLSNSAYCCLLTDEPRLFFCWLFFFPRVSRWRWLVWAERRPVRNVTSSLAARPQSIWNLNARRREAVGASGRQSWSDAGFCLRCKQFHIQQKVRRNPQLAGTLEEMDSSPMLKVDILGGAARSSLLAV